MLRSVNMFILNEYEGGQFSLCAIPKCSSASKSAVMIGWYMTHLYAVSDDYTRQWRPPINWQDNSLVALSWEMFNVSYDTL